MILKNDDERRWFNKAIELLRLVRTYGVDLVELRNLEIELHEGFISNYQKYPASDLRRYIVEAVMTSEKRRLEIIESRQRARSLMR